MNILVFTFFEDGDWLRIESPHHPTMYIDKIAAIRLLQQLGAASVTEIDKELIYEHRNH
jgi:hypothetical protein